MGPLSPTHVVDRSRPSKDVTGVERKERGEHGRTDRGLEEQPADTEAARLDEERRRRRKRERSSLGDADGPRPTSKFPCTEVDVGSGEQRSLLHSADPEVRVRHGKERAERKEHVSSEKKRTHILDSLSDTEPGTPTWGEPAESLLDWSSIAKLPLPLPPPRTVSPMERFDGGAILAEVGSSTLLAGEKLYAEVERAVTGRIQVIQSSLLPETTLQEPFGGEDLACARASYVREQVHQANVLYDLRPCRRALTAQADCNMRKQLRAAASPKVSDGPLSFASCYHPTFFCRLPASLPNLPLPAGNRSCTPPALPCTSPSARSLGPVASLLIV